MKTKNNDLFRKAPPQRGTFFRLQTNKRLGISQAEVYERITLFCKKLYTLQKGKYIDLGAEPPCVHFS